MPSNAQHGSLQLAKLELLEIWVLADFNVR
jgi:hypothetical protein